MSDSQNDNYVPGSLLNIIRPDWLARSGTKYSIDLLSIRFHLEYKCKVNRPIKPSDQEYLYFRAIRDQEVTTNYHLDSLVCGMTPTKKRKRQITFFTRSVRTSSTSVTHYVLSYLFKVPKYFGYDWPIIG